MRVRQSGRSVTAHRRRAGPAVVIALALTTAACSASHSSAHKPPASSTPTAPASTTTTQVQRNTPAKSACTYNAATEAWTGPFGTASAIGWAGNAQAVVTCLGGAFYVQDGFNRTFGFGIYAGGPTTWEDTDGYLPAQITAFGRNHAQVTITELADQVTIGGHDYVAVYARVAIANPTAATIVADPDPTPGLIPLASAPNRVGAHATAVHDYVLAVDRFGNAYPWPTAGALVAAGGFDQHLAHMRAFWTAQLAQIAAVNVPDQQLDDAYKSGFIYTQIARSGIHVNTGVNNYASEFSHDVIGILTNLFTQGDDEDAHALLLEARYVIGFPDQYEDGYWMYSWPWAVYLEKTGDLAFVKANFATEGQAGTTEPSIEEAAHRIAADRTGPGGIIKITGDLDSNGYWTSDDYEALFGLAAYRYLAERVGNATQARWAAAEYESLLAATNRTLTTTIHKYGIDYLPCSMLQPNTANRCKKPEDANWASPLQFGRWAWDGQLFGAPVSGPGLDLIDATYAYGFHRLAGKLPANTFGGFPGEYYSSGYNAGYGTAGLASTKYRDEGILGYEFMIANSQAGPYSWWESSSAPSATTPWTGNHPATGQGSSPHAWGIANANLVLLDSIVAQASDGTLIVGRGLPDNWLTPGQTISATNFPGENGARLEVKITTGDHSVTLTIGGPAPKAVLFQLPVFVNDIASASAGTVTQKTGTVRLPAGAETVTVRLVHAPA
jgi:hypothetical protein